MRFVTSIGFLTALASALAVPAVSADAITKTYEFALHTWHDIDATDGPVTLYRIQLDSKEGRFTQSAIARPNNQEYLETVQIQLEYTNESSSAWKARIGSWFIFDRYRAHEDWCRWRAPYWHGSRVLDPASHHNYHLSFRCCKTIPRDDAKAP